MLITYYWHDFVLITRSLQYVDLNKEVMNVQNQLIKSRGIIAEVINELQLQVRFIKFNYI